MNLRQRAYIIFAGADRAAGERFARGVEAYRLPVGVRGVDYGRGVAPMQIGPFKRGSIGHDDVAEISSEIRAALEKAGALIVLCTPAAARSEKIAAQIRLFKKLDREHEIYPVVLSGAAKRYDAKSAPDGAFPPALYERYNSAGVLVTMQATDPPAPNVTAEDDGPRVAVLELVSQMTGAPLALLVRHMHDADRRERNRSGATTAALALAALAGVGATAWQWRSARSEETRVERAIDVAVSRLDDAVRMSETYGAPDEALRDLLTDAEADFNALTGSSLDRSPALRVQRGRILAHLSQLYGRAGDAEKRVALARAAVSELDSVHPNEKPTSALERMPTPAEIGAARLAALDALGAALWETPGSSAEATEIVQRGRDLAHDLGEGADEARFSSMLGEQARARGDLSGALTAFTSAAELFDRVAHAGGPAAIAARHDAAEARSARAETLVALGRANEALPEQDRVVDAYDDELTQTPDDAALARLLANALLRQGQLRHAANQDWREGLPAVTRAAQLLAGARAAAPARLDVANDYAAALQTLGEARLDLRNPAGANSTFTDLVALRRELLSHTPNDAAARAALAAALEGQGDSALALGRASDAVSSYDAARTLAPAASADDPGAAHDLSLLWEKTARARRAIGENEAWAPAYEIGLRLLRPLVADAAAPAQWRRDLADMHFAYAEQLARANRRPAATGHWRAALDQVDALIADNSADAALQAQAARLRARLEAPGG